MALTVMYPPREWRRVLVLVTAFTVGHSVTLALATVDRVRIPTNGVEVLIPVTILVTALFNIVEVRRTRRQGAQARYTLALVFGLIHGLGFSSFLRAALGSGGAIVVPLFAFNVGLEVGQVVIVAVVLAGGAGATRLLGVTRSQWVLSLSGAAGALALYLIGGRLPI